MALYKIQIWNLDLPIWDRTRLQFRPTSHSETQPRERVTFTLVTSWWHVGDVLRRYQNYVAYELILTAYNSSWVVVNTFLYINRTDFFCLLKKLEVVRDKSNRFLYKQKTQNYYFLFNSFSSNAVTTWHRFFVSDALRNGQAVSQSNADFL